MRIAERLLHKRVPNSLKVYGLLFTANRTTQEDGTLEVAVDAWPDFKVIVCRPGTKGRGAAGDPEQVSLFCTDERFLSEMLTGEGVIDWRAHFMFAGTDASYTPVLKEECSKRGTSFRCFTRVHLLHLPDFYGYCAMGMLHTLPAHRRKGYAKALVRCMARKLHAQGFPLYCYVEEENTVSYRLYKNLGFIEDPSYRAGWFECNF
ncbi:unnamed protein product [Merluccius merluccius]